MKKFDSLEAFENLTENGVPPDQARSIVKNANNLWNDMISYFFTNRMGQILTLMTAVIGITLISLTWTLTVKLEKVLIEVSTLREIVINNE